MKTSLSSVLLSVIIILSIVVSCKGPQEKPESKFPLKEYVMNPNEPFSYTMVDTIHGASWTEFIVKMISGTWLTEKEVDETEWWHWVNIIVPDQIWETESMIIIGGGATDDTIPKPSDKWIIDAALKTGSIISKVSNIPFQPIDFKEDNKGERYEDDLIAYGWRQFMERGAKEENAEWLARFPMTRAVVRAMDVVQEVSSTVQKPVQSFFVTGASKRGWTTWTTAAVDDRVIGIAPIVIDLLNIIPSFQHHWRCYGAWSPAIQDYVNEGIMDWMNTAEFKKLLETVEPYSFIDRLTMPKLLINAASDEFFLTDSWKFYWNDLKGDSYLEYIPNAGHGLRGTYQPASLISFYHAVITDARIPEFNWNISGDTIYMQIDPASNYIIRKWEAVNKQDRDFRIYVIGEAWQPVDLAIETDGTYEIPVLEPETGYKAALLEVIFNPGSDFPLTFTSGTLVTPDKYPFAPFEPETLH
jgi:PhoPQ-activated pathogenicity-related protein